MDPISAMRLGGGGAITPFRPPVVEAPKIGTDELQGLGSIGLASPQGVQGGRAFSDFLGDMVRDVNAKQADAGQAVEGV
ncbi:MAG TPA: hypothetical protein VK633_06530, partial [Verrucomicrobiae bacterium]|nr:hypothetical protein [Verrucomicrobiae bacterium]